MLVVNFPDGKICTHATLRADPRITNFRWFEGAHRETLGVQSATKDFPSSSFKRSLDVKARKGRAARSLFAQFITFWITRVLNGIWEKLTKMTLRKEFGATERRTQLSFEHTSRSEWMDSDECCFGFENTGPPPGSEEFFLAMADEKCSRIFEGLVGLYSGTQRTTSPGRRMSNWCLSWFLTPLGSQYAIWIITNVETEVFHKRVFRLLRASLEANRRDVRHGNTSSDSS